MNRGETTVRAISTIVRFAAGRDCVSGAQPLIQPVMVTRIVQRAGPDLAMPAGPHRFRKRPQPPALGPDATYSAGARAAMESRSGVECAVGPRFEVARSLS